MLNNVKVGFKYSIEVKREKGIKPYILKETKDTIYIHFLWLLKDQKEIVERKLAKMKKGKKIGNLLHEQQSDLLKEEIKERFEWIINFRTTGVYNYDPPASRQRAKKMEERKRTIIIKKK